MNKFAVMCLAGLLMFAAVGCTPSYNLQVSLAPKIQEMIGESEVQVHVIGVNPADKSQFENMSVKSYWQSSGGTQSAREADAYREVHLTKAQPIQNVGPEDEIWKTWKARGVTELLVISNYPPATDDKAGNSDPRRRFLSASPARWVGKDVLLDVTTTGLRTRTATRNPAR